jgi:hypothetical protein
MPESDPDNAGATSPRTSPGALHEESGHHPLRQRVESQWPKSLLGLVLVVAVLGVVKLGSDPRDSAADGLDLIVGSTENVAGDNLRVVATFDYPDHRVEILEGRGVPHLIAVHTRDGRALGVYERLDLAIRSYPEIDSPSLAREFAVLTRSMDRR